MNRNLKIMEWLFLSGFFFIGSTTSLLAAQAMAKLTGTQPGSKIEGTIKFEETEEGLKITARLKGVPPGNHGFHVHENGSCDEEGKAAGSHYNPLHQAHGNVLEGMANAHIGDMGNIVANKKGKAKLRALLPGVKLSEAEYTFIGRSIILHEKVDDFSQPTGNAGDRIACGVITLTH